MQIDSAKDRARSPKMSAFPRHVVPFTEPVSATEDVVIGPGIPMPDLIRKYYKTAVPFGADAKFAFMDRDNKEREYNPAKEDGFVFKSLADLKKFSDEAKALLKMLCDAWVELGFPLKKDALRQVDLPDSSPAWEALKDPTSPEGKHVLANIQAIYFILGNADIMRKACVVRTVTAGWWAVSYKGKKANNLEYFRLSLNAHKKAIDKIMASAKYSALYSEMWSTAGDPLTTNPGYPFYTAQIDKDGNPVTRIKTLQTLKQIGYKYIKKWPDVLKKVDDVAGKHGLPGYPFCVSPIRRLSAGYKPIHQFTITPSGMITAFDEYGVNSIRVAWNVPYAYNVLMTPIQVALKALCYIMPGLAHDGPSKQKRTQVLQHAAKANTLFMAEADYGNYDRFIPIDLIEEIVTKVCSKTDDPTYWLDATMYLHKDASIIWPDFSSISTGNGWAFKPGDMGLMSGVKATSNIGTLVNSVINGAVLANTLGWNESQLCDYLTMYIDSPQGSKTEYYYVASDDTELIATSPSALYAQGNHFKDAVKAAGLKSTVELADRFLMRHIFSGNDRPVPARVWQNTLSNETPPENEVVFLAGLASRTDGLFGIKTVDPFSSGKIQNITAIEAKFTAAVMSSIKGFMTNAAHPSRIGLKICDIILAQTDRINQIKGTGPSGTFSPDLKDAQQLHDIRSEVAKMLANFELSKRNRLTDSWLYKLFIDRNVPSSQLIIDQLTAMNPELGDYIKGFSGKEHAFFIYACQTLGVDRLK